MNKRSVTFSFDSFEFLVMCLFKRLTLFMPVLLMLNFMCIVPMALAQDASSNAVEQSPLKPSINSSELSDNTANDTADNKKKSSDNAITNVDSNKTDNKIKSSDNATTKADSDTKKKSDDTSAKASGQKENVFASGASDKEIESRTSLTKSGYNPSNSVRNNSTIGHCVVSTFKGFNNHKIIDSIKKLPISIPSLVICTGIGLPIAIIRCEKREIPFRIKETYSLGGVPKKFGGWIGAVLMGIPSGVASGVCFGVSDAALDSLNVMEDDPFSLTAISLKTLAK